MRLPAVLALACLSLAVGLVAPAAARASAESSLTMFNDRPDPALETTFTPQDSSVTASTMFSGGAKVEARRSGSQDLYSVDFTGPSDAPLHTGVYDDAVEIGTDPPQGRPGIAFYRPDGRCADMRGRFEVRDIARRADGSIERLWVVYEVRCVTELESGGFATFGEVRVGMPGPAGPATSTPAVARWPQNYPAQPRSVVPVTVSASAEARIGTVSVAGRDASDYAVAQDGCSGTTLPGGGSCQVLVSFKPSAAATRQAILRIPGARDVQLQGWEPGGVTRVRLHGVPNDGVTRGRELDFTPPSSTFRIRGKPFSATIFVVDPSGQQWEGDFAAGCDRPLAPGRYTGVTRYPFRCDAPTMDVTGPYGCNGLTGEFTVRDARFDPDGRPTILGVDFKMKCNGDEYAEFSGSFDFRAGDTVPPAPWMVDGAGPSSLPGDPEPAPGGTAGPSAPLGGPGAGGPAGAPARRAASESGRCARRTFRTRRLLLGTTLDDRLLGGPRAERLIAGAGRDRLSGGRGADCLDGGAGPDRLDGGAGRDVLIGGAGDDVLRGGAGADVLDCGPGRDVAYADLRERTRGCERVVRRRR